MTTAMAIDCHIWALLVDKTLPNSTDSNVIADWVRAQMSTPQARNAVNTIPIDVSRFSRELVLTNPMPARSEEHTSELQSRGHLVCRLLLEKKKNTLRS